MKPKKILITGAGGNLGSAVIPILLDRGFELIAITSPRKRIDIEGISQYKADLTREDDVEALAALLKKEHHNIDAALFLAGAFEGGDLVNTDSATLKRMYSINFETVFYLVKHLFPWMKSNETGGSIVLMGSKPSLEPASGKHAVAYALSKSLLLTLAEQLNNEGAKANVKTFVIAPGTIDTADNRKAMPDADFSGWNKPQDIAQLFADLIEGKRSGTTLIRLY